MPLHLSPADIHRTVAPETMKRRGVLLLVVLSMLTLFMLLGMTYLVLASRTRTTSRAYLRLADEQAQTGQALTPYLHDAAFQVIRGTQNVNSVIKHHDLLADKYGGEATDYGVVTGQTVLIANGDLLKFVLENATAGRALCGRVVTFSSAPQGVQGTSTRILDAGLDSTNPQRSWVVTVKVPLLTNLAELRGVSVNGRDFSGTGFSRSGAVGSGIASLDDSSLLPNRSLSLYAVGVGITDAFDDKQANEDYDAVDEQNWALARADGSVRSFERKDVLGLWIRDHAIRTTGNDPLSRDDVIKEVLTAIRQAPTSASMTGDQVATLLRLRRATLRPFAFDHYQDDARTIDFTGKSLTTLDVLLNNSGDVDNDGDGTLDSIWLDLGYSAIQTPDRTMVKPLVAIHCVDLGGRINLNAHGSPLDAIEPAPTAGPELAPKRNDDGSRVDPSSASLVTGLGFGAADIRLDTVLSASHLETLMLGSDTVTGAGEGIRRDLGAVVGRYGDGVGSASSMPKPGTPDVMDRVDGAQSGVPENYWVRNAAIGAYGRFAGSPPDYWSRLAVGIDHRGHPSYSKRAAGLSLLETIDTPYELNLFAPKPANGYAQPTASAAQRFADQPFTAAELEAILRPFDFDNASALPPRSLALNLDSSNATSAAIRALVTTESWDTPAIVGLPDCTTALFSDPNRFDPDLIVGLKMDINRPFGDGKDNDGNGVVDEPVNMANGTPAPGEPGDAWIGTASFKPLIRSASYPSDFVALRQPGPESAQLRARQLYAYHLFNLLNSLYETFCGPTAVDPGLRLFKVVADPGTANASPQAADAALITPGLQATHQRRVLAQWAVNVVDFLDGDAILTPFRYAAPSNTQVNPTQYVVWGCEQPDLMVTETLAFHDRRTADTASDPTGKTVQQYRDDYQQAYDRWKNNPVSAPPNPLDPDGNPASLDDPDFDQVRIPEGSLFLELHATRDPNSPTLPRELYSFDASSGKWRLDLDRIPAGGDKPVWRLAISANNSSSPNNDVFRKLAANPDTEWLSPGTDPNRIADEVIVERYVWFSSRSPQATGLGATLNNTFFIRDRQLAPPRLEPGGYLVLGPRARTFMGSVASAGQQKWGTPSPQRIELKATVQGGRAVEVFGLDNAVNPTLPAPRDKAFGSSLPPASLPETTACWVAMEPPANWRGHTDVAGVARDGIGLNISEPMRSDYYPQPTEKNPATGMVDAYGPLNGENHDRFPGLPLDRSGTPLTNEMLSGGTYANFCAVFVERLADPTRPHEPDATKETWNPYVVVDFMPIDLTVFNGESSDSDPRETQGPDRGLARELPIEPVNGVVPPPDEVPLPVGFSTQLAIRQTYFHTRQRGFGSDLPLFDNLGTLFGKGTIARNPHPYKPIGSLDDVAAIPLKRAAATSSPRMPGGKPTTAAPPAAAQQPHFAHELGQGPATRAGNAQWNSVPFQSLGWVNPSFGRRLDANDGIPASYIGCPDRPFPWIVWNDRPFANPYELVYVPRTPPGRLFTNYRNLDYPSTDRSANQPSTEYQTQTNSAKAPYDTSDMFAGCTPGAHLLPMTSVTDVPLNDAVGTRNADLFARVFDFVRVRSPFTGTERVVSDDPDTPPRFRGPFNRVASYREPGRINVNTIDPGSGEAIWNAICGARQSPPHPAFGEVLRSGTILMPAGNNTAQFIHPFRTMSGAVPRFDFSGNGTIGFIGSNAGFARSRLSNPQLTAAPAGGSAGDAPWYLLPQQDPPTAPQIGDRFTNRSFTLLADSPRTTPGDRRKPLFDPPPVESWATDGHRNSWFRLQTLVRSNAQTTVRSEVYAIWVTLGLFEVTDSPAHTWHYFDPNSSMDAPVSRAYATGQKGSPAYPDGKKIVREYGSQTGAVTRHRAFYIFDRSIPVEYRPGEDTNVRDGMLIERIIE